MSDPKPSIFAALLKDRAFLITVVILVISAGGWKMAIEGLGVVLRKEPVPWPKHVQVDNKWRNTSFPAEIGPYRLAEDGELTFDQSGRPVKDGLADGERTHNDDILESLFAGQLIDKLRANRSSVWYFSRVYGDSRASVTSPQYKYWLLDVTYYTGALDTVPHISATCLNAGGATVLKETDFTVSVPEAPKPWNEPLTIRRVLFSDQNRLYLQYYLFSMNGEPNSSREMVRAKLASPLKKYVYFAKIQVSPRFPVTDEAEMDTRTREFITTCLPAVLKDIAMPSDIHLLESANTSGK